MTQSNAAAAGRSSEDGRHYRMYIDGAFVEAASGARDEVEDPSTGEVFATCAKAGAADAEAAIRAARRAFDEGAWRGATGAERADPAARRGRRPARARRGDRSRRDPAAGPPDRPRASTTCSGCAKELEYYAGLACDRQGQPLKFEGGLSSAVTREPVGVVAAIVPWNYPIASP